MTLIKCPYCISSVCLSALGSHLEKAHNLELSNAQLEEIRKEGLEITRKFSELTDFDQHIHNPIYGSRSERRRKSRKGNSLNKTNQRESNPKIIRLVDSLNQNKKTETSAATGAKAQRKRGVPILSSKNQYPVAKCQGCRVKVFLVPIQFKNGNQGTRKYDMRPFQPHQCEGKYFDPLDHPRTIRIFQPRDNRYSK